MPKEGCCIPIGRDTITAHVVFRPKWMTPEELADGYALCYERLFSWQSIWKRRPRNRSAVLPYLAMSTLYKAFELALVLFDPVPFDRLCLETVGRVDSASPPSVSQAVGRTRYPIGPCCFLRGNRLAYDSHSNPGIQKN